MASDEVYAAVIRQAAHDAVHVVPLGEQQLGQVRTVLSGDSGD